MAPRQARHFRLLLTASNTQSISMMLTHANYVKHSSRTPKQPERLAGGPGQLVQLRPMPARSGFGRPNKACQSIPAAVSRLTSWKSTKPRTEGRPPDSEFSPAYSARAKHRIPSEHRLRDASEARSCSTSGLGLFNTGGRLMRLGRAVCPEAGRAFRGWCRIPGQGGLLLPLAGRPRSSPVLSGRVLSASAGDPERSLPSGVHRPGTARMSVRLNPKTPNLDCQ
jgi:hypothetical protein